MRGSSKKIGGSGSYTALLEQKMAKVDVVDIKGKKVNIETLDYYEEKAKNRSNLIPSAVRYLEHLIIER